MAVLTEKKKFDALLKEELIPALGCTEPIAIAYCAAYARKVLGKEPERYEVFCSGNIVKNVKSVVVPHTGGMKGIEAAALAGAIAGDANLELQVLTPVGKDDVEKIREGLEDGRVKVSRLESDHVLHIIVNVFAGQDRASAEVIDGHTKICEVTRNGESLRHRCGEDPAAQQNGTDFDFRLRDVYDYVRTADTEEFREVLERQIACNSAISREGLEGNWGACVGKTLLSVSDSLNTKMTAAAAAVSDARMSGCAMPVVINSGSGNQGATISMPVITYARETGASHEELLRALAFANLCALYQKKYVGKLSAFCGATSAAAGAIAGIGYLKGLPLEVIGSAVTNTLGTVGGMICDGAKASCASKIAAALQCALLSLELAQQDHVLAAGDGIVKDTVDDTIRAVGTVAAQGMRQTDAVIIDLMLQ